MLKIKKIKDFAAAKLFVTIMLVNLGNYLLSLVIGRWLGPEQFAEVGILSTIVLVLSFFSLGLQITTAKFTAQIVEQGYSACLFFKQNIKAIIATSGAIMVLLFALASNIQNFFHFESVTPFIIIMISIPFYFVMSAQRGYLQGVQNFKAFANSFIVEMLVRLVSTIGLIALILKLELQFISEAVSLGFLLSFIIGCIVSTPNFKSTLSKTSFKIDTTVVLRFFMVVLFYECSQILISYSDTLLVKHFYTNTEAGLYTALSLIGRMVYFATWAFVMLLIPKVVAKREKGEGHESLFIKYFAIICLMGISVTALSLIMPKFIVTVLFGKAYSAIVPLVWKYSLATTLFACGNLFAYYHISIGSYKPAAITCLIGVLQVALIYFNHQSFNTIIHIQIALMSILLMALVTYHFIIKKYHEKTQNSYSISLSAE